jgi:hypothetical protein
LSDNLPSVNRLKAIRIVTGSPAATLRPDERKPIEDAIVGIWIAAMPKVPASGNASRSSKVR